VLDAGWGWDGFIIISWWSLVDSDDRKSRRPADRSPAARTLTTPALMLRSTLLGSWRMSACTVMEGTEAGSSSTRSHSASVPCSRSSRGWGCWFWWWWWWWWVVRGLVNGEWAVSGLVNGEQVGKWVDEW